ncbi:MAG: transcriptional repressor [Candidatus Hydrogenedentes bacterium]|nr:transcriptional repressor [Candidatus Hydrogenedentota bacterium]
MRLRLAGLRATLPRIKVLELLRELRGHHSADELVRVLQARGERLSRASVFNVLHDLCSAQLIMLTDAGPGRAIYEVADHRHHHFVCRGCGQVYDVDCVTENHPCLAATGLGEGFEIEEAQIIFRGYCPACHQDKAEEVD